MIWFQMSKIPFNPSKKNLSSRLSGVGISALHKRYFYNFSESSGNCRMILSKNESAPISQFPCSVLLILKEKNHSGDFLGLPRTRSYSGLKIIYLLSNSTKLSAEHHSLYILFTWPLDIAINNQHSWSPLVHNMTINVFNHWSQRYPQYRRSILRSHLRPQFGKYLADLSLAETLSVSHTPLFSVSMSPL